MRGRSARSLFTAVPPPPQTKFSLSQVKPDIEAKLSALANSFLAYNFKAAEKTQLELAASWADTKDFVKAVRVLVSLGMPRWGSGGQ